MTIPLLYSTRCSRTEAFLCASINKIQKEEKGFTHLRESWFVEKNMKPQRAQGKRKILCVLEK